MDWPFHNSLALLLRPSFRDRRAVRSGGQWHCHVLEYGLYALQHCRCYHHGSGCIVSRAICVVSQSVHDALVPRIGRHRCVGDIQSARHCCWFHSVREEQAVELDRAILIREVLFYALSVVLCSMPCLWCCFRWH